MRGWQEQLLPAAGLNFVGAARRAVVLAGGCCSLAKLAGAQRFIVCLVQELQRVSRPILTIILSKFK